MDCTDTSGYGDCMIFKEAPLAGAYLIELDKHEDNRGFFARSFCRQEFKDMGLHADFVQCNISFNHVKGTIRGMHYQEAPFEEVKLVRCSRGAIYDVIIDIRKDSATYKQWFAAELSEHNGSALYVPAGFAHGFQTLEDHSEVLYMMGNYFEPEAARGIRWNDDFLDIKWPLECSLISEKDDGYWGLYEGEGGSHT
jgi:dTDP-4-dehydrorhamnose 3,5-epimerase